MEFKWNGVFKTNRKGRIPYYSTIQKYLVNSASEFKARKNAFVEEMKKRGATLVDQEILDVQDRKNPKT